MSPGSAPTTKAVLSWSSDGTCEAKVSLVRPPSTWATQFIGSMAACAR
jgi:hypothetical protein